MQSLQPLVSIIMLACNKAQATSISLESMLKTDYPALEFWLIDNGSTDATSQLFLTFAEKVIYKPGWSCNIITNQHNLGAVAGRNAALEKTNGKYITFIDNDVVAGNYNWLQPAVKRLQSDPGIGALGPKILFLKPENIIQCAGCVVSPSGKVGFRGRGQNSGLQKFNTEKNVQALISACMIMPKAVIDKIGLLDMAYHPVQFEDIDYCYRIREAGYQVLYFPEFFMYHYENITTDGTDSFNYRYLTIKNGLIFKKRWQHMFVFENGPAESELKWLDLPRLSWNDIIENK